MSYRKVGSCKYVEVIEKNEEEIAEKPPEVRVLYKSTINAKEFALYADGYVKTKSEVCGGLFRIALKPGEGKVYSQVDGSNELLARIVRCDKLSQGEKFDMMTTLKAEYFTPQLVAEIQAKYIGRENLPMSKRYDWVTLVESKKEEYSKMAEAYNNDCRQTCALITRLKGELQGV